MRWGWCGRASTVSSLPMSRHGPSCAGAASPVSMPSQRSEARSYSVVRPKAMSEGLSGEGRRPAHVAVPEPLAPRARRLRQRLHARPVRAHQAVPLFPPDAGLHHQPRGVRQPPRPAQLVPVVEPRRANEEEIPPCLAVYHHHRACLLVPLRVLPRDGEHALTRHERSVWRDECPVDAHARDLPMIALPAETRHRGRQDAVAERPWRARGEVGVWHEERLPSSAGIAAWNRIRCIAACRCGASTLTACPVSPSSANRAGCFSGCCSARNARRPPGAKNGGAAGSNVPFRSNCACSSSRSSVSTYRARFASPGSGGSLTFSNRAASFENPSSRSSSSGHTHDCPVDRSCIAPGAATKRPPALTR